MHKMTSIELFCRNLRIFMTIKRLDFAKLTVLTHNKISYSYLLNFRRPQNFNPSIDKLEILANAIDVPMKVMFDPNVGWDGDYSAPDGFIRREALLSDAQNVLIAQWEKENEKRIDEQKKQKSERLRKIAGYD